ncbi:hypothetical protein BX600DRAFT_505834 [Xylariales sp. PMI_506]|nr:hypothetical protein BX600DRAFT_505834 [Xylariales sp. PMI_506]
MHPTSRPSSLTALLLLSGRHLLATAASVNYCAGVPSAATYCTPLTWTAQPLNSSAPTDDECQDACRGVYSDAGDWEADLTGAAEGERRTVVGYPCQFALGRGPGQADPIVITFTNQDIVNIYEGAIQMFGASGQTSASGTMVCQDKVVSWWVD